MNFKELNQYRKLAVFLYKYGTSDLVKNSGLNHELGDDITELKQGKDIDPEEMVKDLMDMGPAFVKMGQLLSTRPDLLPPPYIEALSTLQDDIQPFPAQDVTSIVEEELGVKITRAFKRFDEEPLASASLGQVHYAELNDGMPVAVKIQRPGIRPQVLRELDVLESCAGFLQKNTDFGKEFELLKLVQQFRSTLLRELNYLREAENMKTLSANLREYDRLIVALPVDDYTTGKVLTMEYLKGTKITSISPLTRIELQGERLLDDLFSAYLKQIVVDGFMHADPHPGNIHLTQDHRLAILDMGMVAYISEDYRNHYLHLLLAVSDGRADKVAQQLMDMSAVRPGADPEQFRHAIREIVQENQRATVESMQTGKMIYALISVSGKNGYLLPAELSLIAKALLNLDQVGAALSPDYNPNNAIKRHSVNLMRKHLMRDLTSYNFLSTLLEGKKFVELLPERLNKILHRFAENDVRLKIDALDQKRLMVGLQKIANRITLGLILASLVIGSSLLMRVPTSFIIFGYPGLAIICFLLAAVGAVALMLRIIYSDE